MRVSQDQLAPDAGLDRTFISLLEHGVPTSILKTLSRLAGHLGVMPSSFLRRTEKKPARTGKRGGAKPSL